MSPPPDWGEYDLNELADITFSNVDKKKRSRDRKVWLCNYLDVYRNDYLDNSLAYMESTASDAEILKFSLRVGDVIITKDSESPDDIGIPAIVKEARSNLVCGYHLARIRPHEGVCSSFVAKQLKTDRIRRYFSREAQGTTRYGLSTGSISRAPIWMPKGEDEQIQIAEFLDTLNETISKTEQIITKLQLMKQGLLHDLLTKGLDENGELRDPENHPEQFKDSPIGRVPEAWDIVKTSDIFNVSSGATPSRRQAERFFGGNIPWVKTLDLNEDWIDRTDEKITRLAVAETSCKIVPKSTLLIAMYGGWEQIGRTGMAGMPCATNQAICTLEPKEDQIDPEFFMFAFQHLRTNWKKIAASTRKDPNITKTDVETFALPFPNDHGEQRHIARKIRSSIYRIQSEQSFFKKLLKMKNGLMDDLLTGRVRVSAISRPQELANSEDVR